MKKVHIFHKSKGYSTLSGNVTVTNELQMWKILDECEVEGFIKYKGYCMEFEMSEYTESWYYEEKE